MLIIPSMILETADSAITWLQISAKRHFQWFLNNQKKGDPD